MKNPFSGTKLDKTDDIGLTEPSDYRRAYRELLRTSEHNQRTLWHFQHFELQILAGQDLGSLLELLLEQSQAYFKLDFAHLVIYDPEFTIREVFSESIGEIPPGLVFTDHHEDLTELYPQGVKVRLGPARTLAEEGAFSGEQRPESAVYLPLVRHGFLIGSLHFGSEDDSRFRDMLSVEYLTHFAAVVAICLENCVNRERLRLHSLIDVLTNVRNRRGFEEALDREVARAIRTGRPLTAMFIDLDHFKRVNDRHGHQSGDRALKAIAQCIRQMLRTTDQLARYGGEEFIALLPDCDHQQARNIALRINQRVAELACQDDNGQAFSITCSVGYSSWLNPCGHDFESTIMAQRLVSQADRAVYRAKQEGRNKACYIAFDEE